MAPNELRNDTQQATKWCQTSSKVVPNVVVAIFIPGNQDLTFLWKQFPLYCFASQASFWVVSTSVAQPFCKKYTSFSFHGCVNHMFGDVKITLTRVSSQWLWLESSYSVKTWLESNHHRFSTWLESSGVIDSSHAITVKNH